MRNKMTSNIGKYLIVFATMAFFGWAGFICYKSIPMCRDAAQNFLSTGRQNTIIISSGLLSLCLGWGIIQYLGRRLRNLFRLELFFVLGLPFLIIFFSRTFIEIALFIWIIMLSYAIGIRILRLFTDEREKPSMESFVFSIAIGLGAFSIGTFFVGLAGLLYDLVIYGVLTGLTIIFKKDLTVLYSAIKSSLNKIYNDKRGRPLFSSVVILILLLLVVMNFIGALGPEIMYDSLVYHLSCPKTYLNNHKIIEIQHQFRSYWPQNIEMLFTVGLLLKGQILAKLFGFSLGIFTAIAIYSLCREFYSSSTGVLASAFFYTCPIVAWESTTTYLDVGLTFYCFLSFYACLKFITTRKMHWLIVCGILLGLGLGVKYQAVFTFVTILLIICFYSFLFKTGVRRSIKVLSLFCIIIFLIAAPWYLRSYILTGNPCFPFFNSIFQSPFWLKNNEMFDAKNYGIGYGFLDYLKLPWNVTFYGNRFGSKWESGITFLMFVPLFLWKKIAVWNRWQGDNVGAYCDTPLQHPVLAPHIGKLLIFSALIYSLCWAFSGQIFRYCAPILPVLAIVCASSITHFRNFFSRRLIVPHVLLSLLVLLALSVNIPFSLSMFWNIPTRIPYKVVFGLESRDDYLSYIIEDYKTVKYINDSLDPDERTFSLCGMNNFYCERPLVRSGNPLFVSEFYRAINDRTALLRFLKKENCTYILINRNYEDIKLYESLLSNNDLHLLYAHRNVYLYKILTPRERIIKTARMRLSKNLLKNGSFEEHQGQEVVGWRRVGKPILDFSGAYSHDGMSAVSVNSDNIYTQTVAIAPGNAYTLSHYSKTGTDIRGIYGRAQINWRAQDGKFIDTSIFVYEALKDYQNFSMSATAPEGATTGVIYVTTHGKDNIWFDNFSFIKEVNLSEDTFNRR